MRYGRRAADGTPEYHDSKKSLIEAKRRESHEARAGGQARVKGKRGSSLVNGHRLDSIHYAVRTFLIRPCPFTRLDPLVSLTLCAPVCSPGKGAAELVSVLPDLTHYALSASCSACVKIWLMSSCTISNVQPTPGYSSSDPCACMFLRWGRVAMKCSSQSNCMSPSSGSTFE